MANDFSSMSDDELERAIASSSAPAQPDFNSMSTEDLERAVYGASPKPDFTGMSTDALERAIKAAPTGVSKPTLKGNVGNRTPADPDALITKPTFTPGPAAPVPSMFTPAEKSELDTVAQMPIMRPAPALRPDPTRAQQMVRSAADFVSPGMELAGQLGLNLSDARRAAAETMIGNRAIGPDLAAMASGAIGLEDSIGNFVPGLLQQLAGVPQDKRVYADTRAKLKPFFETAITRGPAQFNQMAGMAPMFAPQPFVKMIPGAGNIPAIANTALNAGGINALLYSGEQYSKGKNVDPLALAGSFAGGLLGGAAVHGGVVGALNTPSAVRNLVSGVVKRFSKLTPEQQKIATAAAAAQPTVEQFAQNIGAKNLPEDTQAMVQASKPLPQPKDFSQMSTEQLEQTIKQAEQAPTPQPQRMLTGKVENTPASGRVVTVNGEQVHLEGDMLQKYEALEARYQQLKDRVTSNSYGTANNRQEVGKALKGLGMKFAAEVRQLTGRLTPTEELKIAEQASKIRRGDWVSYKGQAAKVLRNPAYGKVMIDAGGTQVHADYYDLAKIDAQEIKASIAEPEAIPADDGRPHENLTDEELEREINQALINKQDATRYGADTQPWRRGGSKRFEKINNRINELKNEATRRRVEKSTASDLSEYSEEQILHMIDTGSEQLQHEAAIELLRRHPEATAGAATPLEGKIEQAVQAETPVQAAAAIEKWAEDLTGQPVDLSAPIQGDFRRTITTEHLGRNKNKKAEPLAGHAIFDTPEMQQQVGELAAAKVQKDYHAAVLDKFRRDAFTKFADQDATEFKFPNGAIITKKEVKRSLREDLQHELDSVRDDLATELAPVKSATIESTLTKKFGKGSENAYVSYERVPDNRTEAGELYKDLYDKAKQAEAAYDELKPSTFRQKLRDAEKAKKPNQERIAELKARLEELQPVEDMFSDMERKFQEHTGDVTAAMHVTTEVPHPLGEQFPTLEVGVLFKKGAMEKVIPKEMEEVWQFAKAVIEGKDDNRRPKIEFGSNMRSVKATALAAIVGAFSTIKAEAANTASHATSNANMLQEIMHAWHMVPVPEVMAGLILIHRIMPALAREIMKEDGKLFKMAWLWNDTVDHFDHGEKIAALVQANSPSQMSLFPKSKRSLSAEYWNVAGQTQMATRGIAFDETLKQEAMNELRRGDVTPLEMINGSKGAAVQMTPQQRNALAMWKIGQDHIKGLVEERLKLLRDYREQNQLKDAALDATIHAHEYVIDQFEGKGARGGHLDKFASKLMSNWMDGQFFFNPEFHGTNLFDQLMAVAPAVGTKNIAAANRLLIADAEIKALMHESNLAGGLKVDRAQIDIKAGKRNASWVDKDIESDLYNANAAWIAGTLKYAQNHKPELAGIGFSGSDEQFVRDVLKGKIDPTITMDVWATNANLLSRTLGSDMYQVNTNVLNRSPLGRTLAVFVRQPARISRLAMYYLATGNFTALYTFLGYTLAVGGRSAIPDDLQGLAGLTNAESAYKAAAAADSFDLWSKVAGNKLTPKVNYSIFWGLTAGVNPLSDAKETIGKAADAVVSGKPDRLLGAASSILPAVLPRVGYKGAQLPVGETLRITKNVIDSFKGKRKIYATEFGFKPAGSEEVRMDTPYDRVRNALEPFIPGKDPVQDAYNQSVNEQFARKHDLMHNLLPTHTGENDLFYNRNGGDWLQHGYRNYPDPIGDLLGRKKR